MASEPGDSMNPIAWFTLTKDRQAIVPVNYISVKYILVKLIRSEPEDDNIDVQYLGFVGYS
ncbi:hypothetical protein BX666DRAFT_2022143 [Dichotomocladium elegans]|nr:hypothetical protein BX666DRAFT_2022143 [Dichotomocladium elegans]